MKKLLSFCVIGVAAAAVGCSRAEAPKNPIQSIATIKDIMDGTVDPSADAVWQSVETVSNAAGIQEKQPRTDQEWKDVRNNAIRVIEATNLIMMDGRKVAKPGEQAGNSSVNLQPEEIQKLIDGDRTTFFARATALRDATVKALAAIDKQDPEGLLDAGELMDSACENCHLKYWYPNGEAPPDAGPTVKKPGN